MNLNIFELARLQILKEGKEYNNVLMLGYAIKIRKWLDKHHNTIALKIMQGQEVYRYNNNIKTYARVI